MLAGWYSTATGIIYCMFLEFHSVGNRFFDFRTFCCKKTSGPASEKTGHIRADYGQVHPDEIDDEVLSSALCTYCCHIANFCMDVKGNNPLSFPSHCLHNFCRGTWMSSCTRADTPPSRTASIFGIISRYRNSLVFLDCDSPIMIQT
jgi:hypothetical protein